jgi:hypothetical protein
MNIDTNIVAIVSIIASGIVAISGVILPPLINYLHERRKWDREQKSKRIEKIETVTDSLLGALSFFRGNTVQEFTHEMEYSDKYRELLHIYYKWEQAVWIYFYPSTHSLYELRKKIENLSESINLSNAVPELVEKIIGETRSALKKI